MNFGRHPSHVLGPEPHQALRIWVEFSLSYNEAASKRAWRHENASVATSGSQERWGLSRSEKRDANGVCFKFLVGDNAN